MSINGKPKKSGFDKLYQYAAHLTQLQTVLNRLLTYSHTGICVTNKNHNKSKKDYYNLTLKKDIIELTEHSPFQVDKTTLNLDRGDLKKNDKVIAPKHLVNLNTKVQSIVSQLMESKAVLYRY